MVGKLQIDSSVAIQLAMDSSLQPFEIRFHCSLGMSGA